MRFIFCLFFTIVFLSNSNSQSFEWESDPEMGLCNVPFTKIYENHNSELLIIGTKNCLNIVYKLNSFGQILWKSKPSIQARQIEDIWSYNHNLTYHLIGYGDPDPSRTNLYEIDNDGNFILENELVSKNYFTYTFNRHLMANKIINAGYEYKAQLKTNAVLQFSKLNGDTLGKFEYPLPWNAKARKVYWNEKDTSILLFCSENGYGKITLLNIDTTGNLMEVKVWGLHNDYTMEYYEMAKKLYSYHMIVYLSLSKNIERGYYLFNFNSQGDSIGIQLLNKRYNSIVATKDNGLVLAGTSLLKLDSNLNVVWEKTFKEGVEIQSVGESKLGGYFGSGRIYNKALNEYRTYVFRTNSNGDIETTNNYPQYQIYPNPFKDELRFELPFGETFNISLYDMQGKMVVNVNCVGSTYINLPYLNQGLYMVNITNKEGKQLYYNKIFKID